jgi:hypothetical protein
VHGVDRWAGSCEHVLCDAITAAAASARPIPDWCTRIVTVVVGVVAVVVVTVVVAVVVVIIVVLTIIVVGVSAAGVREMNVGVGRRCPTSGKTMDVDAGRRRGSCGFSDTYCHGELQEFLFVRAIAERHLLLKRCLSCLGCCLPSFSVQHSPSSSRDQWQACRSASWVRTTALGRRCGRAVRTRASGGGRVRTGRVVVVEVRNFEAELVFVEPLLEASKKRVVLVFHRYETATERSSGQKPVTQAMTILREMITRI